MYSTIFKRDFNTAQRDKLADTGAALPDGSFPITNVSDLHNAISLYGRASDKEAAKAHIISRAKTLGATKELPSSWGSSEEVAKRTTEAALKGWGTRRSKNPKMDDLKPGHSMMPAFTKGPAKKTEFEIAMGASQAKKACNAKKQKKDLEEAMGYA